MPPADGPGGSFDDVGKFGAGDQILEPDLVRFVPGRIDGVREELVGWVGAEGADGAVLERGGDRVDVQHRLPILVLLDLPHDDRVSLAFDRPDHVRVAFVAPSERHVVVGLLNAPDDLVVHPFGQGLDVRQVRLGVRVLSLEVRDDGGVFTIVVAEPEEVVVAFDGRVHGLHAPVLAVDDAEEDLVRDALGL